MNPFETEDEPLLDNNDDKIFFVSILRNEETLVRYSQFSGNYDEILSQIMPKIVKTNGIKMTFNYENFSFHYIYDNTIIYFCITKKIFDKVKAFQFLERIKSKFESQYQRRVHTALPFAFNAEFLPILVVETKRYSENLSFNKLNQVQVKVDETKNILCENIDKLTDRGEKLHLLVDKTEMLTESSVSFKVSSRDLARSLYFRNVRVILFFSILILIGIYLIVAMACGGVTLKTCIK
jgi:vesicle-associated membrane protein 7